MYGVYINKSVKTIPSKNTLMKKNSVPIILKIIIKIPVNHEGLVWENVMKRNGNNNIRIFFHFIV